jgi:hypothetical protein
MSSVTRFIRQIPVSTTYYNAQGLFTSTPSAGTVVTGTVFEFVPSASNYVGNYPSGFNNTTGGYVAPASDALKVALQQNYTATESASGAALVLRDMGKTIFAPITAAVGTPADATSSWGYFRQVQLIRPSVMTAAQSFMGGVSGSTFGVLGAANTPDAYTDYLTFYIPVSIGGVTGNNTPVNTQAYALAGGQM